MGLCAMFAVFPGRPCLQMCCPMHLRASFHNPCYSIPPIMQDGIKKVPEELGHCSQTMKCMACLGSIGGLRPRIIFLPVWISMLYGCCHHRRSQTWVACRACAGPLTT